MRLSLKPPTTKRVEKTLIDIFEFLQTNTIRKNGNKKKLGKGLWLKIV